MLPRLSTRIDAVGQIQRFRPRYWKLLFFKQRCREQQWPAVLVDDNGPMATLSLPRQQILVRAPLHLFGEKRSIGQTYSLRLGKIDPLRNEISVLKAEPLDGAEGEQP
jgi:exoribonuclease II